MGRKIYFLRHGEKCDTIRNPFPNKGEGFLKIAFDSDGNYTPHDINMPHSVLARSDGWRAFGYDSPLTAVGCFTAKLIGESFKRDGIDVSHIFTSPALRCVETAKEFIKGIDSPSAKIKIEPGLYEWLNWFKKEIPTWIPPTEYATFGFPVDSGYDPVFQVKDLIPGEELEEFYERSKRVITEITQKYDGNILIVAHAGNLETCVRSILNVPPLPVDSYTTSHFEFLSCIEVEEKRPGEYELNGRPIPSLTVSSISGEHVHFPGLSSAAEVPQNGRLPN